MGGWNVDALKSCAKSAVASISFTGIPCEIREAVATSPTGPAPGSSVARFSSSDKESAPVEAAGLRRQPHAGPGARGEECPHSFGSVGPPRRGP